MESKNSSVEVIDLLTKAFDLLSEKGLVGPNLTENEKWIQRTYLPSHSTINNTQDQIEGYKITITKLKDAPVLQSASLSILPFQSNRRTLSERRTYSIASLWGFCEKGY